MNDKELLDEYGLLPNNEPYNKEYWKQKFNAMLRNHGIKEVDWQSVKDNSQRTYRVFTKQKQRVEI